jgi:hypothetical protein
MEKIFIYHKPVLLFFREDGAQEKEEAKIFSILKEIENRNVFVNTVAANGDLVGHLKSLVGVKTKDYPQLWLLDMSTSDTESILKYKFEVEITSESVMDFISEWALGDLTPYKRV